MDWCVYPRLKQNLFREVFCDAAFVMVGLHGMTWTWKGTMRLEYLVMRVSGSMHQQSRGSRAVPGADCREASGWTVHELLVKAKDPANADADSFLFFPSLPWIHYNYATFTYSIILFIGQNLDWDRVAKLAALFWFGYVLFLAIVLCSGMIR